MKNIFKSKNTKEEEKAKEKKGFFKGRQKDEDHEVETKPRAGEFLENDEDLGYC